MIDVLIVDDHPMVRGGVMAALEDSLQFRVVGAVSTAEEGLALAERSPPDVILLDMRLPGLAGAEAIARFATTVPNSPIVVFTAFEDEEEIYGAIRAGARGYLLKGATGAEIANALVEIHRGGSVLSPSVAAKVVAGFGAPRGSPSRLTDREKQVLRLLAAGQANKQIASALGIAERTVKYHVASILAKLNADNRAQAAAIAVQRGLV